MKPIHLLAAVIAAMAGDSPAQTAPPGEYIKNALQPPGGYLKNALPAPEFYMLHKQALKLSEDHERTLREVLDAVNRDFRAADAEIAQLARDLQAAIEDASRPAEAVMPAFEALLAAEDRAKRVRFRASLAARRMLSPGQWAQAEILLNAAPAQSRGEPASEHVSDPRVVLKGKLDQVRAIALAVFPDGPPPEYRQRIADLQKQVRSGQVEAADRMLDQLIADMERHRSSSKPAAPKP